jgi:hypothetical protein
MSSERKKENNIIITIKYKYIRPAGRKDQIMHLQGASTLVFVI